MEKIQNFMMKQRIAYKKAENAGKPTLHADDVVLTTDFTFSSPFDREGDSGKLLLAKQITNPSNQYFVKHAFTDCACNEYVYTKLAQAMGYKMPDVVLFQLPDSETRKCFSTEHIIGARYLNIVDPFPKYETVRERARNWEEYFCFHGLYAMTGEADGVEFPLVDDGYIYRVDTTDAFPISNYQLDLAGVSQKCMGVVANDAVRQSLQSFDLSDVINLSRCNLIFEYCREKDAQIGEAKFFEPFEKIQEISDSYIDSFLNTLCYFYPDYVGDFFKRYLAALKLQSASYIKSKRVN